MKFMVITSQMYYQRHSVIVHVSGMTDDEILDRLQRMIAELEKYKRMPEERTRPAYYGDLQSAYWKGWKEGYRYNVNDIGGDIYIEMTSSVNRAARMVVNHAEDQRKMGRTCQKKTVQVALWERHRQEKTEKIIKAFFPAC